MMDREHGGAGWRGEGWWWWWGGGVLRSLIGVGGLGCITKHVNKCASLRLTRGFDASFMASDGIPRRSSHILVPLIIQHVYPGNTHIQERSEKLQQEDRVAMTARRPHPIQKCSKSVDLF